MLNSQYDVTGITPEAVVSVFVSDTLVEREVRILALDPGLNHLFVADDSYVSRQAFSTFCP